MIFQPFPTQNPLKNPKNDPPSSIVAYINLVKGVFLTFFMIFEEVIILYDFLSFLGGIWKIIIFHDFHKIHDFHDFHENG